MNKYIIKILIFCALPLFFACNNDNELLSNDIQNEKNDVQVVDGVLKFKNQAVYDSIVTKLSSMNLQERDLFYKEIGFEPITSLLTKADEELEQVVNVRTVEEFNVNYSEFKKKYENVFLFNDQDQEDLSPYTGFMSIHHELVTNAKGYFCIGNDKIVPEQYKSFSDKIENAEFITLRNSSSNWMSAVNHAWSHLDSRKVGLYISMDRSVTNSLYGHPINVTFTSQKKNIFGWVRYSTVYEANFYIYGISKYMSNYSYGHYTSGSEKSGTYSFTLGYADEDVTGTIECWSRGVSKGLRGSASVNLKYNR